MLTETRILDCKRMLLHRLIHPRYSDGAVLTELAREFASEGYVRLPGLLTPGSFAAVADELLVRVDRARTRDFVMDGYETPRVMSVMGGSFLLRETDLVWSLYSHWELRRLVSTLAGAPIYPCQHQEEFMVANFLLRSGNTHGWHLDDPAYALIIFLDAPPPDAGGLLEYVPRWREFCREEGLTADEKVEAGVARARARGLVRVRQHATGDAYLLRADRALHRVTGLSREGVRRAALNLAFEETETPAYGDTASLLYGEN